MKIARKTWPRVDGSVKINVEQVFQQMSERDAIEDTVIDLDDDLSGILLAYGSRAYGSQQRMADKVMP
jgi:hypothetical protein